MANNADQRTGNGRGGKRPPVTAHPAFPAVVALWIAVLSGLGSLLLPLASFETFFALTGLDGLHPALSAPLGTKARIALGLLLAGVGGVFGLRVARAIVQYYFDNLRVPNPLARGTRHPVEDDSEFEHGEPESEFDAEVIEHEVPAEEDEAPLFADPDEDFGVETIEEGLVAESSGEDDEGMPSAVDPFEALASAGPQVFDVTEADIVLDEQDEGNEPEAADESHDFGPWDSGEAAEDAAVAEPVPETEEAAESEFEPEIQPEPYTAVDPLPELDWIASAFAEGGMTEQPVEADDPVAPAASDAEDEFEPVPDTDPEKPVEHVEPVADMAEVATEDVAEPAATETPPADPEQELVALIGQMQETLDRYRSWKAARAEQQAAVQAPVYPHAVAEADRDEQAAPLSAPEFEPPHAFEAPQGAEEVVPDAEPVAETAPEPDFTAEPELPSPEPVAEAPSAPQDVPRPVFEIYVDDLADDIQPADQATVPESGFETAAEDEPVEDHLPDPEPEQAFEANAEPEPVETDFPGEAIETTQPLAPAELDPAASSFEPEEEWDAVPEDVEAFADDSFATDGADEAEADEQNFGGFGGDYAEPSPEPPVDHPADAARPYFDLGAGGGEEERSEEDEFADLTASLSLPIPSRNPPKVSFGDMADELLADYENGYEDEEEEEEPEDDSAYGSLLSMPSKFSPPPMADEDEDGDSVPAAPVTAHSQGEDIPEAHPFGTASEAADTEIVPSGDHAAHGGPVLVKKGQAARAPSLDSISTPAMQAAEEAPPPTLDHQAELREALLHLQRMNGAA